MNQVEREQLQAAERNVIRCAKQWLRSRGDIRVVERRASQELRYAIGRLIQLEKKEEQRT